MTIICNFLANVTSLFIYYCFLFSFNFLIRTCIFIRFVLVHGEIKPTYFSLDVEIFFTVNATLLLQKRECMITNEKAFITP